MTDALRDQHFSTLSRMMENHTGIQLPASKRLMIEGRLRKRVRALGLDNLVAYGTHLFDRGGLENEFPHLVDCVTTNKTDFFREPDHFEFLRDEAVPALLRRSDRTGVDLKIWSSASSTGAEAYTIAMVLAAMIDGGGQFRFSVLGTDICSEVLEDARRAIYSSTMLEAVPPELRKRYIMQAKDPKRDEMRIVPELRRLVRFDHLNLMSESYPYDRDIDVIFCRNVLIYFNRPTQLAVISRLTSHLRPGGYLILGHSESFAMDEKTAMIQILPTVYQRTKPSTSLGRAA